MYWTDLPGDEKLKIIFSNPPEINKIKLLNLVIERDKNFFRVNCYHVPDDNNTLLSPDSIIDFNYCFFSIECRDLSVLNISMRKWTQGMLAKIDFKLEKDRNEIKILADSYHVNIICSEIFLENILALRDSQQIERV
ncbi:hypothetical protein A9G42_11750 [Gilliamella sp. Nev6-6]|uniref:Imm50 family immunity protein n=1 Tax=Gilliamella sp. Nev6-6 TaxID=3120252 RepID=UPI00080F47CE|nr:Imm50 family immunity protein [Gilliamella apicola]OCG72779.1 hypothetical protein A9G42_11750 [Gilliamella apicola]